MSQRISIGRTDQTRNGFTLIELLVVITIIVVLLALLTPALDRAIYQAELAVCGTQLRTIGNGVTIYAVNYRYYYPDRFAAANGGYQAGALRHNYAALDDRPKLAPYIPLKTHVDPLCGKVDLSTEGNDSDAMVFSNYDLYFGMRFYDGGIAKKGMSRLGDRLEWDREQFDVLATDHDRAYITAYTMSSHPDRGGKEVLAIWQNRNFAEIAPGLGTAGKYTLSRWDTAGMGVIPLGTGVILRDDVDINSAFPDGSVRRYNDVGPEEYRVGRRFSIVPTFADGTNKGSEHNQVPVE